MSRSGAWGEQGIGGVRLVGQTGWSREWRRSWWVQEDVQRLGQAWAVPWPAAAQDTGQGIGWSSRVLGATVRGRGRGRAKKQGGQGGNCRNLLCCKFKLV